MLVAITAALPEDAEAILFLQKLAYQSEARLYNDWSLPALTQTIASLREEFTSSVVLKAISGETLVGAVRGKVTLGTCAIGRLVVHPEFQGQGIGSKLLQSIEANCGFVSTFQLFTGSKSKANIRLYLRHGYTITRTQPLSPTVSITFLEKSVGAFNQLPQD
jgi:ribosomal protein S18 acetylase RimI-like enzyme